MLTLPEYGLHPLGIDVLPSPTTTHVGSITDRSFIISLFQQYPIRHVLHCATLHKPHVATHTKQQFIDTNVTGSLVLLEAAAEVSTATAGVKAPDRESSTGLDSFIFFSTTSTFGAALSPCPGSPAAWIAESVTPIPKNIYGVTKVAVEDLCRLIHMQTSLPVIVLKTSRFFPEEDDDAERAASMSGDNLKVLELAYRRVDIRDIVSATVCAMRKAREIAWGKYIISAPPPVENDEETLRELERDPGKVLKRVLGNELAEKVFDGENDGGEKGKGWKFLDRIDRVYDSSKAVRELGWEPKFTFRSAVEAMARGNEWRSELTFKIGSKGYHRSAS